MPRDNEGEPLPYWNKIYCGFFTGTVLGFSAGALIRAIIETKSGIPVVLGIVGGMFIGSIGGYCWAAKDIRGEQQANEWVENSIGHSEDEDSNYSPTATYTR